MQNDAETVCQYLIQLTQKHHSVSQTLLFVSFACYKQSPTFPTNLNIRINHTQWYILILYIYTAFSVLTYKSFRLLASHLSVIRGEFMTRKGSNQ